MKELDDKLISTARLILWPLKASHAAGMFYGLNDANGYDFTPDICPLDVAALAERYKRLESRRSASFSRSVTQRTKRLPEKV